MIFYIYTHMYTGMMQAAKVSRKEGVLVQKLLIADPSEEFRLALTEAFQDHYHVLNCANGRDALSILRSEKCAVLITELMLPQLDGISLLQITASERCRPAVLVVTSFISRHVLQTLSQLGVACVMRKPCDVDAIVLQIAGLRSMPGLAYPGNRAWNPRDFIRRQLLSLGIATKHKGYAYLQEAVLCMAADPLQSLTKELYPAVAEIFGSDWELVERSIRSALDAAWKRREEWIWEQYFPGLNKRPTNAAFISRLAELLRQAEHTNASAAAYFASLGK